MKDMKTVSEEMFPETEENYQSFREYFCDGWEDGANGKKLCGMGLGVSLAESDAYLVGYEMGKEES